MTFSEYLCFLCCVTIVLLILFLIKRRHSYWKRQNVPQLNPDFFYGDQKKAWKGECSKTELFLEIYRKFKSRNEKFGGFYMLWKKFFMPIDPKIVKDILKNNFSNFEDHGLYHHPKDVLFENVFTLAGKRWHKLRKTLGPVFRLNNIKILFELLLEQSENLNKLVYKHYMLPNNPIDINQLLEDLINSTYGFAPNILETTERKNKNFGAYIFKPRKYWFIFEQIVPWTILGYFGHKASNGQELETRFMKKFNSYVKNQSGNIYKTPNKDFMNILLKELEYNDNFFKAEEGLHQKDLNTKKKSILHSAENKIYFEDFNENRKQINTNNYKLTKEEIISHSFLFLASGYETSATSATFVFHDLALHDDIQENVRNEVKEVLLNYKNNFTWEALQKMEYLDKVIKESLRHHPPFARIARICTKDYKIPHTNIIIKKGTKTIIPMWGLHMDAEYFPEPEMFNPEHFSKENIQKRPECTYLPFGEGKRACLGQKLGLMQIKVAVALLVKDYAFKINNRTHLPIRMTAFTIISKIKDGIWLDIRKV